MSFRQRTIALCLGLAVVGAGVLAAQEPGKSGRSEAAVRRVPAYFGQVGLTTQQREAIYTIRGKYASRQSELKRQLEQLQLQELTECESVLNPAQRAQLTERRAASSRGRTVAKEEAKTGDSNN